MIHDPIRPCDAARIHPLGCPCCRRPGPADPLPWYTVAGWAALAGFAVAIAAIELFALLTGAPDVRVIFGL